MRTACRLMIYSRLLFLYGPSLCLRRPPARPRRPPASSPRREARTGVCVLRARFLCIRLFIRFGTPPAAFRSAPSHRTRRLLPHGRGNGVRLFAPRLHTAQELYLCFFGSARPRAAFPRRRNKPAPLRPVPPAPHSAAHRPAAARGLAAPPGGVRPRVARPEGSRAARAAGGRAAGCRLRSGSPLRGEWTALAVENRQKHGGMLHCKRAAYGKYGSGPVGVPPTADLPSGKDRQRSMLGQTRVQRHAVLQIGGIREVQYCAHAPWAPSADRIISLWDSG